MRGRLDDGLMSVERRDRSCDRQRRLDEAGRDRVLGVEERGILGRVQDFEDECRAALDVDPRVLVTFGWQG